MPFRYKTKGYTGMPKNIPFRELYSADKLLEVFLEPYLDLLILI